MLLGRSGIRYSKIIHDYGATPPDRFTVLPRALRDSSIRVHAILYRTPLMMVKLLRLCKRANSVMFLEQTASNIVLYNIRGILKSWSNKVFMWVHWRWNDEPSLSVHWQAPGRAASAAALYRTFLQPTRLERLIFFTWERHSFGKFWGITLQLTTGRVSF